MNPTSTDNLSLSSEQLTLAMGCFWNPEALFGQFNGVIQMATGYAGGTTTHPTYRNLGDHSESIEITFHPQQISLEQLLHTFWTHHRPEAINGYKGRQYMSILFYRNIEQYEIMVHVQQQYAPQSLHTEILAYTDFTRAEERHQKYYLQRKPELLKQGIKHLDSQENLFHSMIGARLNAWAKGYLSEEELIQEVQKNEYNHITKRQQHEILESIQQYSSKQ
ncbi:peptide-methionine (S)-S-oxide reductase MsrA [Paenibacillus nuruki]|uniref:peptide-methionine (S)-S-oxide reductase MsrA n=1 Tax=Paenibacillus nuruki TaxID=1886670 RepID=UPI002803941E|nr:peptide-methionine (S)-S-oxide reductase [Paenibacillus nuruki]CAJ1317115.1 peptide-methionine (S)-S-oxide reductase [Paenibacillus nuruki]